MGRKKQRVRWNPVNPHDPDQATTDMIQMETSTQPQVIVSSTEPVTEEATAASSGMRLALFRFLPAACGMVIGWVMFLWFLGHLAFGLTFYQPHSDMVFNRVELLKWDI